MVNAITVRASYRQFVTDLAGLNCYHAHGWALVTKTSIYNKPTLALFAVDGKPFLQAWCLFCTYDAMTLPAARRSRELSGVVSLLVHVGDGRVKEEALEAEERERSAV